MYIYYGHHKCASTWIWQTIAGVCRDIGLSHRLVLDELTPNAKGPLTDYREHFSRDQLLSYLENSSAEMVSCIAADMKQASSLAKYKGVHVIRDPRDIIVSAYFSHKNSHPIDNLPLLKEHRRRLQNLTFEEGLLLEMDFSGDELLTLQDWDYHQSNVLELRMEDMSSDPYGSFLEVFRHFDLLESEVSGRFLDELKVVAAQIRNRLARKSNWLNALRLPMKATGPLVLANVYKHRYEVVSGGRKKGETDERSHYRKGVHGDWINHFTPRVLAAFGERYGELVIRTGYEENENWLLEASEALSSRTATEV